MLTTDHRDALPPGTRVRSYAVKRVLGSGGFGITYLAEHTGLGRLVALKELLPVDCASREASGAVTARFGMEEMMKNAGERFVAEARQLSQFRHPSIVDVQDIFTANGTAYMVMGYVEGLSLEAWTNRNGSPAGMAQLTSVFSPLLDGLETVHAAGVMHRDLKPQNIYVCKSGQPMLLDFGAAREYATARSRPITTILTPGYAPFEQYHSDGNQGPWTDIYAMGGVLHWMLTGHVPPDAIKREIGMKRDGKDPYVSLQVRLKNKWPGELLKGIDSALELFESKRPQAVAAWRAALGFPSRAAVPRLPTATVPVPPAPGAHGTSHEFRLTGRGLDIRIDDSDFAEENGKLIIGRSGDSAHFVIEDTSVSRAHLSLRRKSNTVEVEDMDSANGTLINGTLLNAHERRLLEDGDELEIGDVRLRFHTVSASAGSSPSAAGPQVSPNGDDCTELRPVETLTVEASEERIAWTWIASLIAGPVGLILACHLAFGDGCRQMPDGSPVEVPYGPRTRRHGAAALICAIASSAALIYFISNMH